MSSVGEISPITQFFFPRSLDVQGKNSPITQFFFPSSVDVQRKTNSPIDDLSLVSEISSVDEQKTQTYKRNVKQELYVCWIVVIVLHELSSRVSQMTKPG